MKFKHERLSKAFVDPLERMRHKGIDQSHDPMRNSQQDLSWCNSKNQLS